MVAESTVILSNLRIGFTGPLLEIPRLHIDCGEVVALLGPSGCGKSSLLATLAGLMSPLAGEIVFDGEPKSPEWRIENVARTLQSFPLLPWLTVRQNLELAAKLRRQNLIDATAHLAAFEAAELADRYPSTLSGGERCRASIAQAFVFRPRVLLLDEPFNGLDVAIKEQVAGALFKKVRAQGIAVAMVTHDVLDAVYYSDRIVVLTKGRPGSIGQVFVSSEPQAAERVFASMGGKPHGGTT